MKIKHVLTVCFLTICFSFLNITSVNKSIKSYASSNNDSEIVMEVNSKRVLYSKNENEKKYMASTTKILTALVVINNCNMSDIITVSKETTGVEGSSIYLEAGEKLTVLDLLYGLMLRSGNDCAETLAKHCSGTIEKFANLMNETAKSFGAVNSNFVNPHGLHDDNHYTTAYDLALISCQAMKNDVFRKIVATKFIKIPFTTKNTVRFLSNKNKMLKEFEGANGIKTGYTKKAGRCLVSSCYRNGMELVCVVLNCPSMFETSKNLLTDCFSKYTINKLVDSTNIIGFSNINREKTALYIRDDVQLPLTKEEINNIVIKYEYPENIDAQIDNDKEIGFVKIYCKNNLIFQEKIYTI